MAVSAERDRVNGFGKPEDGLRQAGDWYLWGPYVSERQWGTVREGSNPAGEGGTTWNNRTTTPAPGLPLGRGRPGRVLRRRAAAVPRARAVERARPDPQGAAVRVDRRRGQPWRGRQGLLVVPRRRAQPRLEPLALPLPAARLPVRGPARRERPARQVRPGVRAARHRGVRRRPVLDRRGGLRQGRPDRPADDRPGHQRRARAGRPARAADGLVPQHLVVGRRAPNRARATVADSVAVPHPFLGELELLAGPGPDGHRADAAVLRERDQHASACTVSPAPRRTPRTASTTTS